MGGLAGMMAGVGERLTGRTFEPQPDTEPARVARISRRDTRIELYAPAPAGARHHAYLHNGPGDKSVVFDGYIANRRELRAALPGSGHLLETRPDTETILHLYEELGAGFAYALDGDFALALADGDSILLARDKFGHKTLYYVYLQEKNLFLFATRISALLQFEEFRPEIDEQKLVDLMVFPQPLAGGSFIKGVRCVCPGGVLRVQSRGGRLLLEERDCFRPQPESSDPVTFEAAQERTSELLIEAVGSRLTADDRLALTLSGGLDSTTLAFIASEYYSKQLSTFTLGSSPEDQDVKLARATANLLKSEHHELFVSFEDYLQAIPRYVRLLERPLLAVETPFLLLCKFMSRTARMCFVGEAADHVFAGGLDYFFDKRIRRRLAEGIAKVQRLGLRVSADIAALVADLCESGGYNQYVRNLNYRGLTNVCPVGGQFYFACAQEFDLEVRDPYLHLGLVNYLSSLPMSFKVDRARLIDKYLLRYTSLSLFGSKVLEAALCRKKGLAGPFREYGKRFEQLCQARLPDSYVTEHSYGQLFPDKHHLILFDLFQQIMIEQHGRWPKDIELLAFIDERAAAPAASRRG